MKKKGRTHLQCVNGLSIPVNKTASIRVRHRRSRLSEAKVIDEVA